MVSTYSSSFHLKLSLERLGIQPVTNYIYANSDISLPLELSGPVTDLWDWSKV